MATSRITLLLACFVLGTLTYVWFGPGLASAAPQLTLTTLTGDKIDTKELKGKPALINFWATTCVTCIEEIPHLVELHHDYADQGLKVITIAMYYDPPTQVQAFVNSRDLPYTVALDPQGIAAKSFGDVQLTPTTFLIDPQGNIDTKKLGYLDMAALRTKIETML